MKRVKHIKIINIIIIFILISFLFFVHPSFSYFKLTKENTNAIVLEAVELNYTITSSTSTNNQMIIPRNSIQKIVIDLVSDNSRETEYEMYYQILSSLTEEEKENITVNCIENESKNLPIGIIRAAELKEIVIIVENQNTVEVILEIGCQGGLVGRELVLKQGESIPVVTNFAYTGAEQVFIANKTGKYKLEVWGAQGGGHYTYSSKSCFGGYGAYSTGIITLNEGDILYINVGGQGLTGTATDQEYLGGYNGGGNSKYNTDPNSYGGSGGGATHIATESGILSTLKDKQNSILIVASGGGGAGTNVAVDCASGGAGGGISGNDATSHRSSSGQNYYYGLGATQTEGGSCYVHISSSMAYCHQGMFGSGGSALYGGAGGGLYGGGAMTYSGGGGSGYIGNKLLINKVMYCYNCTESTDESTKTISSTNISEEAISNYPKIGDGYARITYLNK